MVTGKLMLKTGKRWWFDIARLATVALLRLGIVRDIDRAAEWLIRKGMWYRAYIEDGEGRVKSL